MDYRSVSNSIKWNIQSMVKYSKDYTGISGNNMVKFIHYQILANTLIGSGRSGRDKHCAKTASV